VAARQLACRRYDATKNGRRLFELMARLGGPAGRY
jgi:hypothetical protein